MQTGEERDRCIETIVCARQGDSSRGRAALEAAGEAYQEKLAQRRGCWSWASQSRGSSGEGNGRGIRNSKMVYPTVAVS